MMVVQGLDTNPPKALLRCNLLFYAHLCSYLRARNLVFEHAEEGFSIVRGSKILSYIVCALHYGTESLGSIPVDYPDHLDVVVHVAECQLILSGSKLSPTLSELNPLWRRFEAVRRLAWEDVDYSDKITIGWTKYATLELIKAEYAEAASEWDPVWTRMIKDEEAGEGTVRWRIPVMAAGAIPAEDAAAECRCCGANDVPLRRDSKVEVFGVGAVLM